MSALPVIELRGGIPLAVNYAIKNNIPSFLAFFLCVIANILIIFFIFYFLDNLHKVFLKNSLYNKLFNLHIKKMQKKVDKFEEKYSAIGFLALVLFVAVPLPGTGAWTGSLISWLLDLDRKKSILAISTGVILAGILVLLMTFGFLSLV